MDILNRISFDQLLDTLAEEPARRLSQDGSRLQPRLLTIEQAAVHIGRTPEATQHLASSGKLWWLKYHSSRKVYGESSKSEVYADGERLLKRRLGDIATGKFGGLEPERIKVSQLTDLVFQENEENGKASIADLESRLRLHIPPQLANVHVADFGTQHTRR